ncbi:MAG: hypothetical protein HY706_14900, partial [Candidatus Hydrogenedentes bacterium]|nr:hypothetical protein [Candidatus Hydrogenedentota bacterium]
MSEAAQRTRQHDEQAVECDPDEVVANYFTFNQRNMVSGIQNEGAGDNPRYYRFNGLGERVLTRIEYAGPGDPELIYWAYDRNKVLIENNAFFNTVTSFRHNQSNLDAMGSLVELELSGGLKASPAFDERGSVKNMRDGGVSDAFEYDRSGILLPGVTEGIDTRLRFVTPVYIRETTTEGFYVAPGGRVYVPRTGLLLVPEGGLLQLAEDEPKPETPTAKPEEDECKKFRWTETTYKEESRSAIVQSQGLNAEQAEEARTKARDLFNKDKKKREKDKKLDPTCPRPKCVEARPGTTEPEKPEWKDAKDGRFYLDCEQFCRVTSSRTPPNADLSWTRGGVGDGEDAAGMRGRG